MSRLRDCSWAEVRAEPTVAGVCVDAPGDSEVVDRQPRRIHDDAVNRAHDDTRLALY
jgi:hypothetical protein